MSTWMLFVLALGLSMDAAAVSISNGMCYSRDGKRVALMSSLAFGLFQAGMPMLGYFAGKSFAGAISGIDHWIAFALLGIIGGNMIREALKGEEEESCERFYTLRLMFLQAIATSIDALAVGVGLAVMQVNVFTATLFIGCVTFVCSLIAFFIGKNFGLLLKQKAEIAGGVILIAIGLKILIEHLLG